MKTLLLTTLFFLLQISTFSQTDFKALKYRYVGPTRGGRVTAVAGVNSLNHTFYMGATGGGVWKTEDYGTTWKNVSDGFFETPSIGAISVAENDPNVIFLNLGLEKLSAFLIVTYWLNH